ncbi:MAG: hypothetical protein Q9227_003102 [Pyrenula ochraceoflavens]
MLYIRRLWVLPALFIIVLFYLFSQRASRYSPQYPITEELFGVDWPHRPERYPVKSLIPLPSDTAKNIPKIQHEFGTESQAEKKIRLERQAAVKESFVHSWQGYKNLAWTKDEVAPLSGGYRNTFGGWGATLVDTMDTLWIMGMEAEFEACIRVVEEINWTYNDGEIVNVFETTIRYLGGMLAAYDISGRKYNALLRKSVELGDVLYHAFDTPNRMPMTRWRWKKSAKGEPIQAADSTLIAELGSLSLEFTRLSQLTEDNKYFDAIQRITDHLEKLQDESKLPGLWPISVDAKSLTVSQNGFTLGGMADSTYEYLPKQHLLLGGVTDQYQKIYEKAMNVVKKWVLFRPRIESGDKILLSGDVRIDDSGKPILEPKMQHLACFLGGMVGIGAKVFQQSQDLEIARHLVEGCIWAYKSMPTGLMPEVFHAVPCHQGVEPPEAENCEWSQGAYYELVLDMYYSGKERDPKLNLEERSQQIIKENQLKPGFTKIGDPRYILRPEALESIFVLYRITGDRALQDVAWKMFQDIEKATRTGLANAAIDDVRTVSNSQVDRMESFWLAETLKYLYLIFSEPSLVSLDEYVL